MAAANLAKVGKAGANMGSQLKQGLAGAIQAATGLNVASLGLVGGLTALGAGLAYSIKQAAESQRVMTQTEAVIKSTGGAAGLTAIQIGAMADRLSQMNAVDDEAIQSAENLLLTFKSIKADAFEPATQAAIDLSVAFKMDLQSSVMMVGKALEDPVRGMTALRRAGVTFTADQQAVIKSLVATGQAAAAQQLILAELTSQVGGSATAAAKTYSGQMALLKINVDNVAESFGMRLIPGLTAFAAAMNNTVTVQERYNDALAAGLLTEHDIALIQAADQVNNQDVAIAVLEAAEARGVMAKAIQASTDAFHNQHSVTTEVDDAQKQAAKSSAYWTSEMWKAVDGANATAHAVDGLAEAQAAHAAATASILEAGMGGAIQKAQTAYNDVISDTAPEIEKLVAHLKILQAEQGQTYTYTQDATTSAIDYENATLKAAAAVQKLSEYVGGDALELSNLQVAAEHAQDKVVKLGEGMGMSAQFTMDHTKHIAEDTAAMAELEAQQAAAEAALRKTTAEFVFQKISAGLDAETMLILAENMGLIDPASAAAAAASLALRAEFDSGKISAAEFAYKADQLAAAIAALTDRHVTITVDNINNEITNHYDNWHAPTGQGGYGGGAAAGADFIVPPGFPNDSYPMRVQSGEHVQVTPAGQGGGGRGRRGTTYNFNFNNAQPITIPTALQTARAAAGAW